MRQALPEDTTLLLDEAYIDFSQRNAMSIRLPNTVQVLRELRELEQRGGAVPRCVRVCEGGMAVFIHLTVPHLCF